MTIEDKIRNGDKTVFNDIVILYRDKILNICYRFLLDKEDANDISQEVFIEIYLSIWSFRFESKLSTWIYRIAVSKCLDELKKRKRKKRIAKFNKLLGIDQVLNWIGGGERPDYSILEKEKMLEIKKALDSLPDNQRIAYTLSKIEGYKNLEIAEIMQTTTIAVESLIYRAKKKINNIILIILNN